MVCSSSSFFFSLSSLSSASSLFNDSFSCLDYIALNDGWLVNDKLEVVIVYFEVVNIPVDAWRD
jgi:hypothetical protein